MLDVLAPAGLEEHLVVAGAGDVAMPHHCGAMIAVQQLPGVGAVALGDEAVDPQEQPGLVGGGDAGLEERADAA